MAYNKSKLVHTYKSQSFSGEIMGELTSMNKKLRLISPDFYQTFLNVKCSVGEKVTVTITTKKPGRTESQNRYYWGVYLPAIMAETGEDDIYALHELFKGTCLDGEIKMVLGKPVRIKKSTTELSVSEFNDFVLNIEKMTGVLAPPTESHDLAPMHRPLTPVLHEQVIA